jgi:hypothetical protein
VRAQVERTTAELARPQETISRVNVWERSLFKKSFSRKATGALV